MSNGIEIDITITMGDTCSNTMSLEEARALYNSLGGLFGNGNGIINYPDGVRGIPETRNTQPKEPIRKTEIEKRVEKVQEVEEQKKSLVQEKRDKLREAVTPNPKVESAKVNAAERTRGCGSR